ncbi:MAG: CDP-glucose 4,6-dehydratase [Clostridiales bacterium]|jgi:CDP-glucose 4,6-dehydratase|nr:CDP-glucose 4,6-dehydratase [Clostridiales bacterium]
MELSFWRGKRVFITGHTGFKGSWLCRVLLRLGAELTGYALAPAEGGLFGLLPEDGGLASVEGDIRDLDRLKEAYKWAAPDVAIHMAAQPYVRESYERPAYTYGVNVMGTVNILECVRLYGAASFLNVTTDKVYRNNEWCWGYREEDPLDGCDPYSNSKSCSEMATGSYKRSFLSGTTVSTARAGNVIGGGDFAPGRIIPDCARAAMGGRAIAIRNPDSVRPYQHVLEPLFAYLLIARAQMDDPGKAGSYNVGPGEGGCASAKDLADLFCRHWGGGLNWEPVEARGPHEAGILRLDCSKIRAALGWKPKWGMEKAVEKTVEWYKALSLKEDVVSLMDRQIEEYCSSGGEADV